MNFLYRRPGPYIWNTFEISTGNRLAVGGSNIEFQKTPSRNLRMMLEMIFALQAEWLALAIRRKPLNVSNACSQPIPEWESSDTSIQVTKKRLILLRGMI